MYAIKSNLIFFAAFCGIVYFSSCTSNACSTKTFQCPAFNDSLFFTWFPYTDSQKLIFHNQAALDTITIGNITRSASYSTQASGTAPNPCGIYADITSVEGTGNATSKLYVYENIYTTSSGGTNILFEGWSFYTKRVEDSLFVIDLSNTGIYSAYYNSVSLNGNVYTQVQMIGRTDTLSSSLVLPDKIYFKKGNGIIAYETYPAKLTWTIQ